MKKVLKVALTTLLIALIAVVFVACNDAVTSISVDEANMPQTTFVQGNDLDLSKGQLIVNRGAKTEKIPLNSTGVDVSGYDKNALGKQELTITYGEQSTTLSVTTVKRIASDGLTLNYFVGEELDVETGRIRITNDDGTSFVAKLTDAEVTVSDFSTQNVGAVNFKVKYSKNGTEYESTLTANVYAIASYSFQRPSKLNYYSHEGLDLSGGRISYRNTDGTLTRTVTLDESMISGFDLSLAGPDNKDLASGLKQTITVKYRDFTGKYDISIIFSDVSLVKLRASQLADIDWSKDTVVTDEQGAAAVEAVNAFAKLSAKDRNYIEQSEKEAFVRAAAVYGLNRWKLALASFDDTFTEIDGAYSIKRDLTYATAVDTIEKLGDKNNDFYVYADMLAKITSDDELAEIVLFSDDDVTAVEYLAEIMSGKEFDESVLAVLEYMVSIYDGLSGVPSNWRELDLDSYRTHIASTYNTIYSIGIASRGIHSIVNSWRNDFFDILYTYYLGLGDAGVKVLDTLATYVYLPGQLEDLHTYMYAAFSEHVSLNLYGDKYDTTGFMLYFVEARKLQTAIQNGNNELYKEILKQVGFTDIFQNAACTADFLMDFMLRSSYYASTAAYESYFKYGAIGYYSINGAMQDVAAYEDLWNSYLALVNKFGGINGSDSSEDVEQLLKDIEALLKKFVAASPVQQLGFIQSVNAFYSDSRLEFDFSKNVRTLFAYFIDDYYSVVLPERARDLFNDLMMALESFVRRDVYESYGFDNFRTLFASADVAYKALSGADKTAFDEHALFLYEKCKAIYEMYGEDGAFVGSEEQLSEESAKLLEALKVALRNVNAVASLIYNEEGSLSCFAALYANYEVVNDVVRQILNSNDPALLNVYYYGEITLFDSEDAPTFNPEFLAMLNYRGMFYDLIVMHQVMYEGNSVFLYDVYHETGLPEFLKDASYVIMQYVNYLLSQQAPNADEIDFGRIKAIVDKYHALGLSEQALLLSIDRNLNPSLNAYTSSYHLGLMICYSVKLDGTFSTEDMGNGLVYQLFYVTEIDYVRYYYGVDRNEIPVTKSKLLQDIQNLKAAYEALDADGQAAFDALLGDVYATYVNATIE